MIRFLLSLFRWRRPRREYTELEKRLLAVNIAASTDTRTLR